MWCGLIVGYWGRACLLLDRVGMYAVARYGKGEKLSGVKYMLYIYICIMEWNLLPFLFKFY